MTESTIHTLLQTLLILTHNTLTSPSHTHIESLHGLHVPEDLFAYKGQSRAGLFVLCVMITRCICLSHTLSPVCSATEELLSNKQKKKQHFPFFHFAYSPRALFINKRQRVTYSEMLDSSSVYHLWLQYHCMFMLMCLLHPGVALMLLQLQLCKLVFGSHRVQADICHRLHVEQSFNFYRELQKLLNILTPPVLQPDCIFGVASYLSVTVLY